MPVVTMHTARPTQLRIVGGPCKGRLVVARSASRSGKCPTCRWTPIVTGQTERGQRTGQRRSRIRVIQFDQAAGMLAHVVTNPAIVVGDGPRKMFGGHLEVAAGPYDLTT